MIGPQLAFTAAHCRRAGGCGVSGQEAVVSAAGMANGDLIGDGAAAAFGASRLTIVGGAVV